VKCYQLCCTVGRLDVMTGFAVSGGCEGGVLIWTKWEGELASNFFILLNKQIANTFVQNETAVTTHMFYNDTVFSNIHTACEKQVAVPAQRNNCRFTLVTGRHWLLPVVPIGTCTPNPQFFPPPRSNYWH
jgi:hypothetical protein